jgi:putative endopeptidase
VKSTRILAIAAVNLAVLASVAPISVAGEGGASSPRDTPQKGIEHGDLNLAADPCTDFYDYANGAWRAANPIPAGTQHWSRRWAARETNRRQLKSLLEELSAKAARPQGSVEQQLGDYYAACMDEPAIEAAGVAPLSLLLADIAGVEDAAGIQRMIGKLHALAVPAAFTVTGASDYRDPESVVVNIAAGGMGLPDREYYVSSETKFEEARRTYRAHIARVLALGGMDAESARKSAGEILALETRLAQASLPSAAAADPAATAHKMTFAELSRLAGRVEWEKYFAEAGLPKIDVNVADPAFLERLNRELEATPVTAWKAYLTWQLLESAAPWLSKPFADESFGFRDKFLGGATEAKPRGMRCLESTEIMLGEPLGRVYAERYFPPAARARVQEIVRALLAELKDDLRGARWMSDATRREALAKIESYDVKVGYPDVWTDYSGVAIRRDAFWSDVAAARRFGVDADRRRVGQRASRALWQLPPSSPDAYIDIQLNVMALPAGFLQPPAFDLAASDAVNYGSIGVGIAHDLTHAIDALGADFDAAGRPRKWWAKADWETFQRIARCTVDQYDGYAIEPGVHLQGRLVLGEALGDLAGLRLGPCRYRCGVGPCP